MSNGSDAVGAVAFSAIGSLFLTFIAYNSFDSFIKKHLGVMVRGLVYALIGKMFFDVIISLIARPIIGLQYDLIGAVKSVFGITFFLFLVFLVALIFKYYRRGSVGAACVEKKSGSINDYHNDAVGKEGVSERDNLSCGFDAGALDVVEEEAYARVYEEVEAGRMERGLWTKLLVEFDGDEGRAKLKYIKIRVKRMMVKSVGAEVDADAVFREFSFSKFNRDDVESARIIEALRRDGFIINLSEAGRISIRRPVGSSVIYVSPDEDRLYCLRGIYNSGSENS